VLEIGRWGLGLFLTFWYIFPYFQLASSDGQVVEATREMAHNRRVPYFRMTPSLEKDIQLDTIDNNMLIDMLWTTKVSLTGQGL
jgi:hypothetical protein